MTQIDLSLNKIGPEGAKVLNKTLGKKAIPKEEKLTKLNLGHNVPWF